MDRVEFFKENSKSKNTSKATNSWMRNYWKWAENNGAEKDIEKLDSKSLNALLENYFANVKRTDGKEYEPTSLCSLQAAIDRYLKEKGSTISIQKDMEFNGSRSVLEGKARYLRKELGMGKHPNRANSLMPGEEELLWSSGQLGSENPRSLTNTMWYLLTLHFGLRGRDEHYEIRIEDLVLKVDDENTEYYMFSESSSKTRQGGLRKKERLVKPKMFATGGPRCPVMLFKQYKQRRPEDLRETGAFYLAIIDKPAGEIWYKVSRLGINYINNIMKSMVKHIPELQDTGKRFTNHTSRKTLIKKMKSAHIPRSEIIGITGHSNERGLDPYDSGDEVEQRHYSNILDNVAGPSRQPTVAEKHPEMSIQPSFAAKCQENSRQMGTVEKHTERSKRFVFFSDEEWAKWDVHDASAVRGNATGGVMNFFNCQVNIGKSEEDKTVCKRRRVMIIESDSSQE